VARPAQEQPDSQVARFAFVRGVGIYGRVRTCSNAFETARGTSSPLAKLKCDRSCRVLTSAFKRSISISTPTTTRCATRTPPPPYFAGIVTPRVTRTTHAGPHCVWCSSRECSSPPSTWHWRSPLSPTPGRPPLPWDHVRPQPCTMLDSAVHTLLCTSSRTHQISILFSRFYSAGGVV